MELNIFRNVGFVTDQSRNKRLRKFSAGRNAQPFVIAETFLIGTFAFLGKKQFIRSRVVNDCGGNGAVFENGDRNGKLRNAVGKIIQTVNRRNDKTRAFRLGLSVNGNRKIGLNTSKFGTQGTIYFSVSRNDKILIAFDRRLKLFNLAEVPIERAGRLFDGINQQGHERGKVRHAILLSLHKWLRQCRQRFCHRC